MKPSSIFWEQDDNIQRALWDDSDYDNSNIEDDDFENDDFENDDFENDDYYYSDYEDNNHNDGDDFNDDSDDEEKRYSIEKAHVVGYENSDEIDEDYIINSLEKDTHVYLRYDFEAPDKKQALQVYRHSHLLGYVEESKVDILHNYLRKNKIDDIIVSGISDSGSFEIDVYYEDTNGIETRPYYPFEGRIMGIVEGERWTGQKYWFDDWWFNPHTDELSYKYSNMFDDTVDDDEKLKVDVYFVGWCSAYLSGTCITKQSSEYYVNWLSNESAKSVMRMRIESYLKNKGFHFAEKEVFVDDDDDDDNNKENQETCDNTENNIISNKTYDVLIPKTYTNLETIYEWCDYFSKNLEPSCDFYFINTIENGTITAYKHKTKKEALTFDNKELSEIAKHNNIVIFTIAYINPDGIKMPQIPVKLNVSAYKSDNNSESSTLNVVKQYSDTYEIRYYDCNEHFQSRTIKNANMNSFIAGISFRDDSKKLLSQLSEGMEVQLKPDPDNEFDPNAIAVFNEQDHLGYIPKRDLPVVALNIKDDILKATISSINEGRVGLIIPVTFYKLTELDEEEMTKFHLYRVKRIKLSNGFGVNFIPITREEFLDGIKHQEENLRSTSPR